MSDPGRRVFNFRPAGGAAEARGNWTETLRDAGIEAVDIPLFEIQPISAEPTELEKIQNAWVILTSANAALFSLAVLKAHKCFIACVGEQTGALLKENSIHVDFIPQTHDAESLARELLSRLQNERVLPRCVFLRGETASERLPEILRAGGVTVQEVVVYRSRELTPGGRLLELLRATREEDALIFTNSESVHRLVQFAGSWNLQIEKFRDLPAFVIGPQTANTLAEAGFRDVRVAKAASLSAVVELVKKG